jgi:hypothetical protein
MVVTEEEERYERQSVADGNATRTVNATAAGI